jgi:hypothetical protein
MQAANRALGCNSCLDYFLTPYMEGHVPLKRLFTSKLHCGINQNIGLIITAAVRTSNHTRVNRCFKTGQIEYASDTAVFWDNKFILASYSTWQCPLKLHIFVKQKRALRTVRVLYNKFFPLIHIVTCIPIARQRLDKHIPAEAYTRNNRTSIAGQRISKQAFSTIEWMCFLRGPCRGVIKGRIWYLKEIRVEAGPSTSTVILRVVGGDEKEVSNLRQ